MRQAKLGPFDCSAPGLGCMNLSHGYGRIPSRQHAVRLLNQALDLGYSHMDTAALYGFGENEKLLGEAISHRRNEFVLASKCGIGKNAAGKREINGHPDALTRACEASLKHLRTEVIDLYYLHRWDKRIAIEESIGALARLVGQGKIRTIGLSEVSAATLRKAQAVHNITAVQSEYSLWTRNPELGVLDSCRELGVTFVAFSPLGRGFLTNSLPRPTTLQEGDIRRSIPRFCEPHFSANLRLHQELEALAAQEHCTMAQLALAWLLTRGEDIIPIPGTTSLEHLADNAEADAAQLSKDGLHTLEQLIDQHHIAGERYSPNGLQEVDTEGFTHLLYNPNYNS